MEYSHILKLERIEEIAVSLRSYEDIDYSPVYDWDMETEGFTIINDLDGVQFCINAKTIDVSNNRISDLTPLFGLTNLKELNLSDNQIFYIDGISNLINMKSILLANNYIEDISPLFELEFLEYADLTENKLDINQINKLIESGVVVDY